MSSALPIPRVSAQLYLTISRELDTPHEYYDGQVYQILDVTLNHDAIAFRLHRMLDDVASSRGCRAAGSRVRVQVGKKGPYFYPDIFVVCGPVQMAAEAEDSVTNPTLIVEVLSKSTEDFDHGRKFVAYQQIPSFREYLLVSQNEPMVRAFRRNDLDQWTITTVSGLSASLRVETLDCEIPLSDLYADVTFPPPDDAA